MHKSFAPERRSAEGQPPLSRRRWQIGLLLAACLGMNLMLSGGIVRAAPTVTTLTVNNPTCAQLQVATNACVIKIRSISASSTDPLFSHVEISVNGKLRAHLSAFFEQNIYLISAMLAEGLQVSCGLPGASGDAAFGNQYSVGISAHITGSPPIVDVANVTCPYYVSKSFLPLTNR
jgi:hypothetical protein